ncbi:MAG: hypothetical protein P8Y44_06365 [Acidobacteriota bacterium]
MALFNSILGTIFELVMAPFRTLPTLGLVLISAVVAVGMLLVFKKTSNQAQLDAVKRRIHACLFEIRLFNDDLSAIMRAQLEILRHNFSYLRLQLVPLLFILPPMIILLVQLQPFYGYSGFEPGDSALLKVHLNAADGADFRFEDKPAISLELPAGVELDSPSVWIPSESEMAWRIQADQPGRYELQVRAGEETFAKTLLVSEETIRRSPLRATTSLDQFLYPVEKPLPKGGPIASIELTYPEDPYVLLMPKWMWIFFILTIVFAFALRKPMGVTI